MFYENYKIYGKEIAKLGVKNKQDWSIKYLNMMNQTVNVLRRAKLRRKEYKGAK